MCAKRLELSIVLRKGWERAQKDAKGRERRNRTVFCNCILTVAFLPYYGEETLGLSTYSTVCEGRNRLSLGSAS